MLRFQNMKNQREIWLSDFTFAEQPCFCGIPSSARFICMMSDVVECWVNTNTLFKTLNQLYFRSLDMAIQEERFRNQHRMECTQSTMYFVLHEPAVRLVYLWLMWIVLCFPCGNIWPTWTVFASTDRMMFNKREVYTSLSDQSHVNKWFFFLVMHY